MSVHPITQTAADRKSTAVFTHQSIFLDNPPRQPPKQYFKINVKEKGKVNDNTAKMQSTNQLGV